MYMYIYIHTYMCKWFQ